MMIVALDKKIKRNRYSKSIKTTIKPTDMITAILDIVVLKQHIYIIFEFRLFFLSHFLNSD